ncbi:MAG: N-acylneuraminate cytidylyltransferase/CMP-N,N'-diacetyllegionaminic acid synthase [Candidatus Methanomarinus sp.]|nr:MAG: N-acylneuraminate cytidylyltransferase/CMP-N,N'-diacetyllegionaminic acid synthase [ANME-2 cluster archaeon]KAF5425200.1 N-acylneuraminate cytidylyltransferase [ANME-2 cluster archaeon]
MKVIAIIPARGGSKGIPKKNIKMLAGKPLIAHIIETALKVRELDRVIVSTEDEELSKIANKYGAEVPFIRPEELARDETPTLPVLQHAIEYLEEREDYKPDIVLLLYATSPLLKHERVSEAIRMLKDMDFDSVLSVVEDRGHYFIERGDTYERLYPKVIKNRQYVKPLFKENGAIYMCKRSLLMEENTMVGGKIGFLKMQKEESIDVDELIDFEIAEFLMRNGKNGKNWN